MAPRAIQPESRDLHVTSGDIERVMLAGGPSNESWKVQNEECLTLSVWTPQPIARRNLPVMFWCHGGKYFGETPPVWWFDGGNLAEREQVVVVTVRHRVGVLGFLNLADLPGGSTYRDSANVGMLDLVLALQWVKDNIGAFGGDPDNVTLYGQSGGGLKVSVLLRMPEASGLFHKAIIQSGAQMEAMTRIEGTETALALNGGVGPGSRRCRQAHRGTRSATGRRPSTSHPDVSGAVAGSQTDRVRAVGRWRRLAG